MTVNLRNLPLTALRTFEVVGRHCHIRRAAEEMHISHPALSKQIKQLETYLDAPLFYRKGNRLELTRAGHQLLHSVQEAFKHLQSGIQLLETNSIVGELTIATTPTIAMSWLLQILKKFQGDYPGIDVRIQTIEPAQTELPTNFDVAICLGKPEAQERVIQPLYEERYLPVANPEILPSERLSNARELNQYPLLHDRLNQWQLWFKAQNLEYQPIKQHTYFDHAYQAIEAARLSMGIALAEPFEVKEDIKNGRLTTVLDTAFTVGQTVYLVCDEENYVSLRARLFIERVKEWLLRSSKG